MKMNSSSSTIIRFASLFLSMALCTSLNAQTMFRCGSTYQDRPCDEAKHSKTLTAARTAPAPASGTGIDAFCSQRGAEAQKIVWAREGGAMLDQQLAKSRNGEERKLVSNVYSKRGSSTEVRKAIETECIQEQEKAARMAALIDAARPASSAQDAIRNERPGTETKQKISDESRFSDTARQDAANKKAQCDAWNETLANIRDAQRAGGNMTTMDTLYKQKASTEQKLTQNKC